MNNKTLAFDSLAVRAQITKYLDFGMSPIWLKGKVANYHWKDFTLTKANMNQFTKPGINWGLRSGLLPSGVYLWFIDLDSKDLLANAIESNPTLLDAPIVSTGKGFHIYLIWTHEVKTKHLPNIDIIGNGYVVAPPSIHQSGKHYQFIKPLNSLPPMVNPEALTFTHEPPPIIIKSVAQVPLDTMADSSEFMGTQQGQRHNTLVRIIGIELARHFTEEETLTEVLTWNKKNKPPLTQPEVINTVHDCYERWDRYEVKKN